MTRWTTLAKHAQADCDATKIHVEIMPPNDLTLHSRSLHSGLVEEYCPAGYLMIELYASDLRPEKRDEAMKAMIGRLQREGGFKPLTPHPDSTKEIARTGELHAYVKHADHCTFFVNIPDGTEGVQRLEQGEAQDQALQLAEAALKPFVYSGYASGAVINGR